MYVLSSKQEWIKMNLNFIYPNMYFKYKQKTKTFFIHWIKLDSVGFNWIEKSYFLFRILKKYTQSKKFIIFR